jgi:glycosyltransferase involved in cell wall biosynthesis
MKILYLCSDAGIPILGRKGASVHVRELVAAFSRAGHEVVVAAPLLNKSPWEKPAPIAGHVLHVRAGSGTQSAVSVVKEFAAQLGLDSPLPGELRRILYVQELAGELRRRFDNDPPDFIYERAAIFGTAGVTLAREWNVPHLLELNAPLAAEQSAYRGSGLADLAAQAERWMLTKADAVLAVSALLREHVIARGAVPERVHVFPNGVNPDLFHPAPVDRRLRARLGLDGGPVIGFLGGLRPWHGIEVLPELLDKLSHRHKRLQLVIAGDGQLRPELELGLRQRRLLGRAVFTGALAHEDVPGVLRQFDVALAPYPKLDHDFYFSPLKLFEYMACGAAIVASRAGQIAEVVQHGKTGLLCPPGDVAALVGACDRLLRNARLRRAFGRAAAKAVAGQFTWDANARRAVKLAKDLLAASKAKA